MAEVIGSAAYALILDSTEFEKGAKLTRTESTALRKTLRDIETPAEKHQKKLDNLAALYRKGAIDATQLRVAVDKLEAEQRSAAKTTDKLADAQDDSNQAWSDGEKSIITFDAALNIAEKGMRLMADAFQAVMEVAEEADEIAKFSRALGIATDDLQRLQYTAGQIGGVTADQVQTGLRGMTKRLEEARQGTGKAVQALELLNIEAESLSHDPYEAFLQLSEAISRLETPAEQAAVAMRLLGDDGAQMALVMAEGRKGIEEYGQALDDMGGIMSDEDLENMEAFNDQWDDFSRSLENVKRILVTTFAPTLTYILDTLTDIANVEWPEWFSPEVQDLMSRIGQGAAEAGLFGEEAVGARQRIEDMIGPADNSTDKLDELIDVTRESREVNIDIMGNRSLGVPVP